MPTTKRPPLDTRAQDEALERAMRVILKLFAEGRLTYRERGSLLRWDVGARAARVRGCR